MPGDGLFHLHMTNQKQLCEFAAVTISTSQLIGQLLGHLTGHLTYNCVTFEVVFEMTSEMTSHLSYITSGMSYEWTFHSKYQATESC